MGLMEGERLGDRERKKSGEEERKEDEYIEGERWRRESEREGGRERGRERDDLIFLQARYMCPVTHDVLGNSIPCAVLKTTYVHKTLCTLHHNDIMLLIGATLLPWSVLTS